MSARAPAAELLRDAPARIAAQADVAKSIDDLKAAALRVDALVQDLHASGVPIAPLMRAVSELNTHVFARLWSLLAPPAWLEHSCLLAMGSEGRGEQILKTDQDNALVLRDGFAFEGLPEVTRRFSAALARFGYPPCPGGIMLTTPLWRQPIGAFRETLRQWLYGQDPDGPMNLAIFFDAAAVAGDEGLLAEARKHLDTLLAGQDQYLARFAAPADQFAEPGNFWTRLTKNRDDLDIEWSQLLLEQSSWATHARVEQVARDNLRMKTPQAADLRIVQP